MVELNPSRWLLVAGIFGTLTPWVIHWSDGFFTSRPNWHPYFVIAYFGAIAASLIAFFGAITMLSRGKVNDARETELVLAVMLGACGLMSALLVFGLSMM